MLEAKCPLCCVQLPLQQLAWMLFDQDCRIIICGTGPAGAVAQHATSQIQQQLRELAPDQVVLKGLHL